jgi:hypothetical protein
LKKFRHLGVGFLAIAEEIDASFDGEDHAHRDLRDRRV